MSKVKNINLSLWTLITVFISPLAFSDVPVYNESKQGVSAQQNQPNANAQYIDPNQTPLTLAQRVTKLERQIAFQNRQDLIAQISNLQQEIQDLRGQIEVQAFNLRKLRKQQAAMYMQTTHSNPTPKLPITSVKKAEVISEQTITNNKAVTTKSQTEPSIAKPNQATQKSSKNNFTNVSSLKGCQYSS